MQGPIPQTGIERAERGERGGTFIHSYTATGKNTQDKTRTQSNTHRGEREERVG